MARSRLNDITSDAINDGGTVLISLVQGEQIELPINVDFIEDPSLYIYEAALVEADNVADQTSPPDKIKTNGLMSSMVVRIPTFSGAWSGSTSYSSGTHVSHEGAVYERVSAITNTSEPGKSADWALSSRGRLYVQIPAAISQNYLVPTISSSVYGFFELRVTERVGTFPKTFKLFMGTPY